jgi:formylglycine-generating enzyme required for sulfatase activity
MKNKKITQLTIPILLVAFLAASALACEISLEKTGAQETDIGVLIQQTMLVDTELAMKVQLTNIVATIESKSAAPATATETPPVASQTPTDTQITSASPPTQTATPEPGEDGEKVSPVDQMTMVLVPAGEFMMGPQSSEAGVAPNEKPNHRVFLDSFWIDKTEVTNAMYALCVKDGRCSEITKKVSADRKSYYDDPKKANFPVIYVSWQHAQDYCTWAGRRLPTEAEWEKAARGVDDHMFPWGDEKLSCEYANYWGWNYWDSWNKLAGEPKGCSDGPTEVGSFPAGASPNGALDMLGNVAEWVADWYSGSYYSESPTSNPSGPSNGQFRVIRGVMGYWELVDYNWIKIGNHLYNYGDWRFNVRIAARSYQNPSYQFYDVGFRCAASP